MTQMINSILMELIKLKGDSLVNEIAKYPMDEMQEIHFAIMQQLARIKASKSTKDLKEDAHREGKVSIQGKGSESRTPLGNRSQFSRH